MPEFTSLSNSVGVFKGAKLPPTSLAAKTKFSLNKLTRANNVNIVTPVISSELGKTKIGELEHISFCPALMPEITVLTAIEKIDIAVVDLHTVGEVTLLVDPNKDKIKNPPDDTPLPPPNDLPPPDALGQLDKTKGVLFGCFLETGSAFLDLKKGLAISLPLKDVFYNTFEPQGNKYPYVWLGREIYPTWSTWLDMNKLGVHDLDLLTFHWNYSINGMLIAGYFAGDEAYQYAIGSKGYFVQQYLFPAYTREKIQEYQDLGVPFQYFSGNGTTKTKRVPAVIVWTSDDPDKGNFGDPPDLPPKPDDQVKKCADGCEIDCDDFNSRLLRMIELCKHGNNRPANEKTRG